MKASNRRHGTLVALLLRLPLLFPWRRCHAGASAWQLDGPIYAEPILQGAEAHAARSIFLRHLDCGSCNACELELIALGNPVYDSERYGIKFEASPRHADAVVITGPYTRNLQEAAQKTLGAMPVPRVITVGDCTCEEDTPEERNIFREAYAVMRGYRDENDLPVVALVHVPGCPPCPEAILRALAGLTLEAEPTQKASESA